MWTTLNISPKVRMPFDNGGLTIDKQNSNLVLLFVSVNSGLMAFVCGRRAPSFIRLCKVDFGTPIDFARQRMFPRRRNGSCET